MKVQQQPAYVLHTRPYRETSLTVELFTMHHGRVAGVAKGVRRRRRGGNTLQPFLPLLVSWVGRGPLFTLTDWERAAADDGVQQALHGDELAGGFYMNELLMRLLEPLDVHTDLFALYSLTLDALAAAAPMSVELRRFEQGLLQNCGYLPDLRWSSAGAVTAEQHYELTNAAELHPCSSSAESYEGAALLAIAAGDYASKTVRRVALDVFRQLLRPHLGDRPLISRALLSKSGGCAGAKPGANSGGCP